MPELESYSQNRVVIYDTEEIERSYNITAGVPQGSILGPVLWNASYDGVLRLKLPPGVKLVGFADDITLVIYDKSIGEGKLTARNWHSGGLDDVEAVGTRTPQYEQRAVVTTGQCTINSKRSTNQPWVMIDDKLKFGSHVEYACKGAMAIMGLSKIMSNSSAIVSVSCSQRTILLCNR